MMGKLGVNSGYSRQPYCHSSSMPKDVPPHRPRSNSSLSPATIVVRPGGSGNAFDASRAVET